MSRSKAIRQKRLDCAGGSSKEALFSHTVTCPYFLSGWDLRPGTSGKPMGVGLGLMVIAQRATKPDFYKITKEE